MSDENTLSRMSTMNRALSQVQPYWNNSLAIRQEIQRFESVHPSIYAIYDLIESIPDPMLGQQIRDHVVCIEGESCRLHHSPHRSLLVRAARARKQAVSCPEPSA